MPQAGAAFSYSPGISGLRNPLVNNREGMVAVIKPTVCASCLPLPSELRRPKEDLRSRVLQELESFRINDNAGGGLPESHDPGVLIPRLWVV